MVPFWIPIIIRHLIFSVPKRDHNFDNHPHHFVSLSCDIASVHHRWQVSWTVLPGHQVLEHALHIRSRRDDSGGKVGAVCVFPFLRMCQVSCRGNFHSSLRTVALCAESTTATRPAGDKHHSLGFDCGSARLCFAWFI